MKNIIVYFAIMAMFLVGSVASAQSGTVLPKAGLTPENPFYFLDKLGETLQELFTLNPEGKARLQLTFAAERVAEIKIILETKGVEAKGLVVAEARLREHFGEAAEIIVKEKSKGKDVSKLSKELEDELEESKSAFEEAFEAEEGALETREDAIKAELKVALNAGDKAKAEALTQELGQVKAQLELLELKGEEFEDDMDEEEEELEEAMEELKELEEDMDEEDEEDEY